MPDHDGSYGDILRAIGVLEGKLDKIGETMASNRADIVEAFRRLSQAEQRIAQGVVLAIMASIIVPIVVTMLAPRIEFGPEQPRIGAPRG